MEGFGNRLREERTRLGLSQAKFANQCGVKRTAQTTYETGERFPSAEYLQAAGRIGVDAIYLLIGMRTSDDMIRALAAEVVLGHISRGIGIDSMKLRVLLDAAADVERKDKHGQPSIHGPTYIYKEAIALLHEAGAARQAVNIGLLSDLIERVELSLQGQHATPSRKAGVIAILYKAFCNSGEIDQSMIDEVIRISATN